MKNLPQIMPVFPLEGTVMFPNTYLPLNIFEPRYLKMIDYSMSQKNRLIGMIQPKKIRDKDEDLDLYNVGCAGRIIKFEETEDSFVFIFFKFSKPRKNLFLTNLLIKIIFFVLFKILILSFLRIAPF